MTSSYQCKVRAKNAKRLKNLVPCLRKDTKEEKTEQIYVIIDKTLQTKEYTKIWFTWTIESSIALSTIFSWRWVKKSQIRCIIEVLLAHMLTSVYKNWKRKQITRPEHLPLYWRKPEWGSHQYRSYPSADMTLLLEVYLQSKGALALQLANLSETSPRFWPATSNTS